jgi:pimeloyl-ACP methyl ester carboxylesterase
MSKSQPAISTIVRSFIGLYALRLGYRLGSRVAPAATVERAAELFCTPHPGARQRAQAAPLGDARLERHLIDDNHIAQYTWGDPTQQPYVLFAHGWSSHGARILPWVEPLRASGHAVVAFDQVGHGRSDGARTTLVEFTRHLLEIGRRNGPAAAVIGHSLGGAAAGLAMAHGLQATCAILVAPAADTFDAGHRFARQIGLSEHLCRRMFELFEERLSMRFTDLQAERTAPCIGRPGLIVHDLEDREVPWCEGERWARYWPGARLLSTHGLGHHRILDDPGVIAAALAFLQGHAVGERAVSTRDLAYGVA